MKTWIVIQSREYEIKADSADEAWLKWMDSNWETFLEEEPEVCTLYDDKMTPVEDL